MMETISLTGYPTGATLYAFPVDQSLDDWLDYRVLMVEGSGDDVGKYSASVDPEDGYEWYVFIGSSQPIWGDAIPLVIFDLEGRTGVASGEIVGPIVIGDDYTVANGRAFLIDVELPANTSEGAAFVFTGRHRYRCDMGWSVAGVIGAPVAGIVQIPAELPSSASEGLEAGEYVYTISITDDDGGVVTPVASLDVPVELIYGRLGDTTCQC